MEKECKYCKETIKYEKKQQLAAHVGNCKDNPKRKLSISSKVLKRLEYNVKCIKCNTEYKVSVTENDFMKGNYRKCCTRKCANTKVVSEQTKKKTSKVIKKLYKDNILKNIDNIKITSSEITYCNCKQCNKLFTKRKKYKTKTFCSQNCIRQYNLDTGVTLAAARKGGLISVHRQAITKRSQNETLFAEFCKIKFKNVETNKPIFKGWDADVIIHDLKLAVMWNGIV